MQVRGRLDCGGPDLDFIGYGSNFELLAHYGFGGTATGGDSDHKSVILDLKFRDLASSPEPNPQSRNHTSFIFFQDLDDFQQLFPFNEIIQCRRKMPI